MLVPLENSFDIIYNYINDKRKLNKDESLIAEYAKLPSIVLRLSAVLHVIEEVSYIFKVMFKALTKEHIDLNIPSIFLENSW